MATPMSTPAAPFPLRFCPKVENAPFIPAMVYPSQTTLASPTARSENRSSLLPVSIYRICAPTITAIRNPFTDRRIRLLNSRNVTLSSKVAAVWNRLSRIALKNRPGKAASMIAYSTATKAGTFTPMGMPLKMLPYSSTRNTAAVAPEKMSRPRAPVF
ncbi:hypothetical protein SDC9_212404 [bioreactor metagenome]|uniref:Uncharacterized protein n=1 Tax=bioreactor metagenome TaxID=1076179 RepID=A0A645JLU1_9ZZZZ